MSLMILKSITIKTQLKNENKKAKKGSKEKAGFVYQAKRAV